MERLALIGITVVGMGFCTFGIGKVAAANQWLSAPGILGSLIGVAILAVVGARLIDRSLPYVASDLAAIGLVLALAAVKVGVAAAFRLA